MRLLASQRIPVDAHTTLGADVYLPATGKRHPTVLSRTPYDRTTLQSRAAYLTAFGYAFVAQDVRGRFDSDGVFDPLVHEQDDGYATLQWIVEQAWCDGRIGMCGASYGGMAQWYAALSGHPALRCIAPAVAPGSFMDQWVRHGGCFAWANMVRWLQTWTGSRMRPPLAGVDWDRLWRGRDLGAIREACGFLSPVLERWLGEDRDGPGWRRLDVGARADELQIPILHLAGWWDHLSRLHLDMASGEPRQGPPQHLIVGPWGHSASVGRASDAQTAYGDWSFSDAARMDTLDVTRRFLDHHLKGDDRAFAGQPYAQAFVMGDNRWHTSDRWPPAEATPLDLHLAGRGDAVDTEGELTPTPPDRSGEVRYTYDPADPCPTRGGPIYWGLAERYGCGPVDLRPTLERSDVAVFRSPPLTARTTLIGPAQLRLMVTIDADDTDLIARLAVQDPVTGRVDALLVGSRRLRYRDGFADPRPIVPGEPTPVRIDLGSTACACPAGGRLVLAITSSDFPRLLPSLNRFDEGDPDPPRPARIQLHGGGPQPARLQLLTMPAVAGGGPF